MKESGTKMGISQYSCSLEDELLRQYPAIKLGMQEALVTSISKGWMYGVEGKKTKSREV